MPKLNYVGSSKKETEKKIHLYSKKTKKHSGSFSEYLSVTYIVLKSSSLERFSVLKKIKE
jgi:hypothetical protein